MVGHIGDSASHIIDEYLFETLADFEAALAGMGQPVFKPHSDALAPLIIPGTQEWKVYRLHRIGAAPAAHSGTCGGQWCRLLGDVSYAPARR